MTEAPVSDNNENAYLQKFKGFLVLHEMRAEIIDCGTHTLTIAQSAAAIGCSTDHILKTLLFHDGQSGAVIAIASGLSRVDIPKLLRMSGLDTARLAKPAIV